MHALELPSARASQRCYIGVAKALLVAGAELEPRFADEAAGELAGWLDEHL